MLSKSRWAVLAVALFLPGPVLAQTATITGTVRSSAQVPIPGAVVELPSLELTTVTNDAGMYRLVVPANRISGQAVTLRASSIGYRAETLQVTLAEGSMRQDITLSSEAIALDEVMVTGTTVGSQQRRANAAQIASVNAADVVAVSPVSSVQEILTARVPGVSVTSSSGTSGGTQQIRVRGLSSISLDNDPLIFIDGVLANNRSDMPFFTGGQASSRLNDINPDDIESIEIVKGPAAATLYGADASAGVIQIITKRGRAGTDRFTQSLSMEYNQLDSDWTPPANWATCQASDLTIQTNPCFGQTVGTIVSDNPLVREDVFRKGEMKSFNWSGRGGGENYGYFLSLGVDDEFGTLPNNAFDRRNARVNFNWIPHEKVSIDAGIGLVRTETTLPDNDNNVFGFLGGALLGSPRLVGRSSNGWYAPNRNSDAIRAIVNQIVSMRNTPTLTFKYTPVDWFTNRLTVGADLTRMEALRFLPRNTFGWWGGDRDFGDTDETRQNFDVYTFDYQGNVRTTFGAEDQFTSDLTLGTQITDQRRDLLTAHGTIFVTNEAREIGAATIISADQQFTQERAYGLLGGWTLGYNNRLFLQLGGRLDKNSSFGVESDAIWLPKAGLSWVVSEEPFFADRFALFNTLRLRGAYGVTGRAPTAGASLRTYDPAVYQVDATSTGAGAIPLNPGNFDLKAERGSEIELGLDAGLIDDRLGVELTYFKKTSKDLLLQVPLAPSIGFNVSALRSDPWANVGEVVNSGLEVALRGTMISSQNFGWDARVAFNTLSNEVVDLGEIPAYGTNNRVAEGKPLFYFNTYRILRLEEDRAIVTDTAEYAGNILPDLEGNASTNVTFFRNLRLYGQVDWKQGYKIYNNTDQFRERQFNTGDRSVNRADLPAEERLSRFGPFYTEAGVQINRNSVNDRYFQDGDYVRLREVSATYTLPSQFSSVLRATGASITIGARNLALWTDYEGADPEILSSPNFDGARSEFLTLPQAKRYIARVNLQF